MTDGIKNPDTFHAVPYPLDLELLEALLESEDYTYPWNPADAESAAYFYQLEQQFTLENFPEAELRTQSQDFYHYLDTLWSETTSCNDDTTKQSIVDHLQEKLDPVLAGSIPQIWLKAIIDKAVEVFSSQRSTGEQLADCVQAVLPNWGVEDILVLARPFAYAMRGNKQQNLEFVMNLLEHRDWGCLSTIEQIKASLAIADYALSQLNSEQQTEA
jgi:hypothetical protein